MTNDDSDSAIASPAIMASMKNVTVGGGSFMLLFFFSNVLFNISNALLNLYSKHCLRF